MKKPTETKKQDADANNDYSKHISSAHLSSSEWPSVVTMFTHELKLTAQATQSHTSSKATPDSDPCRLRVSFSTVQ